jgi:glutamate synthase (NADPH/NADH)
MYNVMTKRFLDDGQGNVNGVEVVSVLMERDPKSGQMRPVEVRGGREGEGGRSGNALLGPVGL